MANMQRLQPLQNRYIGSKIKITKKVPKTTPESDNSSSMQKTAILKIHKNGQYAKAIALAKSPHWVKN